MPATLADHLAAAIRHGEPHRTALAAALRADPAMLAQARELLALLDATIAARGEAACWLSARDARVLRAAIQEAG